GAAWFERWMVRELARRAARSHPGRRGAALRAAVPHECAGGRTPVADGAGGSHSRLTAHERTAAAHNGGVLDGTQVTDGTGGVGHSGVASRSCTAGAHKRMVADRS